ncbi:helix-turn-helix domain-containing protein [Tenuibacillus multivorans]|uniref:Transcriptional regulator, contains XRE-family HTH domain n=1 Tax=Tenuibacillus multivorans TaxID=237069 RepID=A0A1H0DGA6_9BACI|nr:helix-turn-helix transcriptional regulator [Tenuibacillus multivorans]GEL76566.1 HTH-type transcriptional regulator Xre [Tenuibacillus multivorans]SDN69154.1 Transcriptional regulator, contains XRE-family HTH domain [Tenuibacillus multivorans]
MFANMLIKLRKQKKLSQYQLAEKLGFSRGKISNYEQGQREPDFETLKVLADFFNVSTDYLLTGEEKVDNLYFFDLEGLSEEEIEDIKEHIEYMKWKKQRKNN